MMNLITRKGNNKRDAGIVGGGYYQVFFYMAFLFKFRAKGKKGFREGGKDINLAYICCVELCCVCMFLCVCRIPNFLSLYHHHHHHHQKKDIISKSACWRLPRRYGNLGFRFSYSLLQPTTLFFFLQVLLLLLLSKVSQKKI